MRRRNNGRARHLRLTVASALALTSIMVWAEGVVCSAAPAQSIEGVTDGRHVLEQDHRLAGVRARQEAELMQTPGVVGVAQGVEVREGRPGSAPCLVVYVTRENAETAAALPDEIEGVPVYIVDVGAIEALPQRDQRNAH